MELYNLYSSPVIRYEDDEIKEMKWAWRSVHGGRREMHTL